MRDRRTVTCCALLLGNWLSWASAAPPPEEPRWRDARLRMVQEEVVGAGINDARIAEAMRGTPRHLFVPPGLRQQAYLDMALPIGEGQTISPPYVVAFMTQQLDPQPTDKVLEIGTGSGYQAAVLSPLVAEVYSIEIVEALGRRAAETLQRLEYPNVHTRIGDGFQGWPEAAPFDKIIVTCSPERVPATLVEQLREGGRIVVPLGERYQQTLYLLRKVDGKLEAEALEPTFFVPMTGQAEQLRQNKADSGIPELINGDFEQATSDGVPVGWYYLRQGQVAEAEQAPSGQQALHFRNDTPGRGAQILQSLAMDGQQVQEIELRLHVAGSQIRPGPAPYNVPHLEVNFFDERRAHIGSAAVGPFRNTTRWTRESAQIKVPPQARLAVMGVGLFGASGELWVDNITLRVTRGRKP